MSRLDCSIAQLETHFEVNLVNDEKFYEFFKFVTSKWFGHNDILWDFKFPIKPSQVKLNKKSIPYQPKAAGSHKANKPQIREDLKEIDISTLVKTAKSIGNLQAWSVKIKTLKEENPVLK